ncbi:MAG: flagellar basal body rod protein FlgB [Pseudomonadales bacterium]|nr:flagellar basal body rod protein FlgB [Pseudomonadales bacterium]
MAISFANALGIHEQALNVRVKRAELLANNLVNADTPGFKARDIDFKAVLQGVQKDTLDMEQTNSRHLSTGASSEFDLMYRNPVQPAIDGNTVDTQLELAAYTKNNLDYEASFQFLNSKFKGLSGAIKGE